MTGGRPIVFLGPSLPVSEARQELPDAVFLPPVKRGSLYGLLPDLPSAIGIVDGEFYQSFAISTQEILVFLERGVPVFGSSSMGALRAVELDPHGMIGVGTVYRMFRSGALDADDEVAMTFCPDTLRPLSEPMVNFRVALAAARRAGLLTAGQSRQLCRCLKAAYFPERTMSRFFAELARVIPQERLPALREWWREAAPNAKADDARRLLWSMRHHKL